MNTQTPEEMIGEILTQLPQIDSNPVVDECAQVLGELAPALVIERVLQPEGTYSREQSFSHLGSRWESAGNILPPSVFKEVTTEDDSTETVSVDAHSHNYFEFYADLMKRGFCVMPNGDDHEAIYGFNPDRSTTAYFTIYMNPDLPKGEFIHELSRLIRDMASEGQGCHENGSRIERLLRPEEIREAIDMALLDERYAALKTIEDAHMARVKANGKFSA